MPTMINGIGTTYYGRKNLKAYDGRCEACRRVVQLQEYQTRLWFVVVYVPVIPLGRKQLLDDCTVCHRHRAVPLAVWEKAKEESIALEAKSFSANPDDPEAAIKLLRTLAGFSQYDQAEKLAQGIEQRFSDDDQLAAQWQAKACEMFDDGRADQRQIAKLLRQGSMASDSDLKAAPAEPESKSVLLVAVALQSPEPRDQLLVLAEKLNFLPTFPHHFIERAVAAARRRN